MSQIRFTDLIIEAKEIIIQIFPIDKIGENPDAERLYEILNEIQKTEEKFYNDAQNS